MPPSGEQRFIVGPDDGAGAAEEDRIQPLSLSNMAIDLSVDTAGSDQRVSVPADPDPAIMVLGADPVSYPPGLEDR